VHGTADLALLTRFPELQNFQLVDAASLRHLETLANLPALGALHLPLLEPNGIPGLPVLPDLFLLGFSGVTSDTRLDFLAPYSGVEYLHLLSTSGHRLPELAPLSKLPNLRNLRLFGFDTGGRPPQIPGVQVTLH
jgi:hypothetical protein